MTNTAVVQVDRDVCEGHALCLTFAPDVFELDDEERAIVIDGVDVQAHLDDVRAAVNACPVQALTLGEESA